MALALMAIGQNGFGRSGNSPLNHIYHSWTLCQFYSSCQKRGYHLNGDPFFGMLSKSMHQIAQIGFENCKVFIASEGHIPLRHPFFKQGRSVKCYIQIIVCMFQSITQETLGLLKFEWHFLTSSDNLLPDNQISFQNS